MFAVIFEVQPKRERWDDYLALAKLLKPKLEAIDGFIDNDRFASKRTSGRLLSLSTWRDEKSVVRWRIQSEHHGVQEKGRQEILENYHLRVGEITADTAPGTSLIEQRFDETEIGAAKICTITEWSARETAQPSATAVPALTQLGFDPRAAGLLDHENFESIYTPGEHLVLGSWRDAAAAKAWEPMRATNSGELRHRVIRIIRDYGMFERREAPQFYPDAGAKKQQS